MTKLPVTEPNESSVWAYAYQIEPHPTSDRLDSVGALLEREQRDAGAGPRTWQGRLVTEEHVTHILVVSDSPAQDLEVNRRLEAALRALGLGFTVTASMPVEEEPRV